MRYVYCGACEKVSTNLWREHDVCMYCGNPAHPVPIRTPWQTYAGGAVFVLAAAALVLGLVPGDLWKTIVVVTAVVAGFGLSSWGLRAARVRVRHNLQSQGFVAKGSP